MEAPRSLPRRFDDRIILHFDYDCFYASVIEAENPEIREKSLPLAVQQKQIIVTCNYEARRRGLRKLQLISEAKKICPEVIIVLGEDLNRFRDASKKLYLFLQSFVWSHKAERLGFDEVFLDVSEMIDENLKLLNSNDLQNSFFQLSKSDPLAGFSFDARSISGNSHPSTSDLNISKDDSLFYRLVLGSHLAEYLRRSLKSEHGYTCTAGISTSKLLSKLVGNVNKPDAQTTLLPPYSGPDVELCTPATFLATFDIGAVPGIGFRTSNKLRQQILQREPVFDAGLVYGGTLEKVTVRDVREGPGMGVRLLSQILGGPGAVHDIGSKVWSLLWGVDDTEVAPARAVPRQISIEDSYIRLDEEGEVRNELRQLGLSLLRRMHTDLLQDDDNDELRQNGETKQRKFWIACPRTIRLSTRPRPPVGPDGNRARSFARISRSAPLPSILLSLTTPEAQIIERLIAETLWPMFKKLHPEKKGWNLSLVNLAVTNMDDNRGVEPNSMGNIGALLQKQGEAGIEWRVEDKDVPPDGIVEDIVVQSKAQIGSQKSPLPVEPDIQSHSALFSKSHFDEVLEPEDAWESWDGESNRTAIASCSVCGSSIPLFAVAAHERFHSLEVEDG